MNIHTEPRAPERRRAASLSSRWLGLVLEELDYGVLLVSAGGELIHSNRAARAALGESHPLQIVGGQLRARLAADIRPLFEALAHAEQDGRRCLLHLGEPGASACLVVVPLNRDVEQAAVLLILAREQLCGELTTQWFALRHGLTPAETDVLRALSSGAEPGEVASAQGVAISTVRTQIQSIRSKSGAANIRELLRQLSLLPPLVSVLRN